MQLCTRAGLPHYCWQYGLSGLPSHGHLDLVEVGTHWVTHQGVATISFRSSAKVLHIPVPCPSDLVLSLCLDNVEVSLNMSRLQQNRQV
jgi:hypothetical protein